MNDPEGHAEGGASHLHLQAVDSLGEILETAIGFERTARDFYASLVDRVSKPLQELVAGLAEEEQRHVDLFESLLARDDVSEYIDMRIATPPSDHRFSNYVQVPDLGDDPDEQTIIQYAMGREQAAMEQYGALAGKVPDGPLKKAFEFLCGEETAHKSELEKRYYALVYPSNV
jgi:rubrerythrin